MTHSLRATQYLHCSKAIISSVLKGNVMLEEKAQLWKSYGPASTLCKATADDESWERCLMCV